MKKCFTSVILGCFPTRSIFSFDLKTVVYTDIFQERLCGQWQVFRLFPKAEKM